MHPDHIHEFLQRFASNSHTDEEHRQFINWLENAPMTEVEHIAEQYRQIAESAPAAVTTNQQLVAGIEQAIDASERKRSIPLYKKGWFSAAAAVLLLTIGAGIWWMLQQKKQNSVAVAAISQPVNDVSPGSNKAILVLADGTEVKLDSAKDKTITEKNGHTIANSNGLLSYAGYGESSREMIYHTIKIPRKGQYHLRLSDGTNVWLNAESSLTYPAVFQGNERKVTITGEAYFEVTKNPAMPFRVMANGIETRVLGTHFNVNAYDNEALAKITLLEGAVKVTRDNVEAGLKPGQQAQFNRMGKVQVVDDANLDEVMAWKNGLFEFDETEIQAVMRQLARWYDIEVDYQGDISQHFNGAIPRNVNVSKVLDMLEQTGGVKFKVEGNKVTVKK